MSADRWKQVRCEYLRNGSVLSFSVYVPYLTGRSDVGSLTAALGDSQFAAELNQDRRG
jgi:hypothetical protein